MNECWSYFPQDRPSFRVCLDKLEALKKQMKGSPKFSQIIESVYNQNYVLSRKFAYPY